MITPDDLRAKIARVPELRARLHAATERLNESLRDVEDAFARRIARDIKARVFLRKHEGAVEYLTYDRGLLYIERQRADRWTRYPLLSSSRESRMAACARIPALWEACGGQPLPK